MQLGKLKAIEEKLEVIEEQIDEERRKYEVTTGVKIINSQRREDTQVGYIRTNTLWKNTL